MKILKPFVDSQGTRHKIGAPVPDSWDKPTLNHYMHHGMVGPADDLKPKSRGNSNSQKKVAPTDSKPADAHVSDVQQASVFTPPNEANQDLDAGSAGVSTNADGHSSDS